MGDVTIECLLKFCQSKCTCIIMKYSTILFGQLWTNLLGNLENDGRDTLRIHYMYNLKGKINASNNYIFFISYLILIWEI